MDQLNAKQQRFVREYLKDLNATQAAIRSGYKAVNADVTGSQLLGNIGIAKAVAIGKEKQFKALDISAQHVLSEIAKLSFVNMDDFIRNTDDGVKLDLQNTTRDQRAAIAEITEDTTGGSGDGERKLVVRTKVKLYDKTKNLELLGRHLKLFIDKTEISVSDGLAALLAFKSRFEKLAEGER